MDVTFIGLGNIGGTLGTALARAGHTVTFGVRDPENASRPEGAPDGVEVIDVAGALARVDVVVLALPGPAVADLVAEHSPALDGPLVIDATNNIGGGGPANGHDLITTAVPGVRYARAFNTLGWENLRDPEFAGERADMLFSAAAADRPTVTELIDAVGLRPVWVGENTHDTVDGLLPVWFALARTHGRHLAFRVLTDTGQV
jgi:8-hydroxy-5-deazaflavin:NADPH oxidoreductase